MATGLAWRLRGLALMLLVHRCVSFVGSIDLVALLTAVFNSTFGLMVFVFVSPGRVLQ